MRSNQLHLGTCKPGIGYCNPWIFRWLRGNQSRDGLQFNRLDVRFLKYGTRYEGSQMRSGLDESQTPSEIFKSIDQLQEVPSELTKLGRYQVVGVLGKGGNAVTLRCKDTATGIMVAVKVLSLRNMKTWKQLELFERESSILKNLNHPNIPSYLDSFEIDSNDDRTFCIVQELAKGSSLQELVNRGHKWTDRELEHILIQLLKTLEYLSELRPPVVHRDVKPSNIIIDDTEDIEHAKVMLVDFGGVQAAETSDMPNSTIVGTFEFLAPEQFRGRARTYSDLYSTGATLLYLATGRLPSSFPEVRLKLDLSEVNLSPRLKAVISGFLEPLLEDRLSLSKALDIIKGRKGDKAVGGRIINVQKTLRDQVSYPDTRPVLRKPVGTRIQIERSEGRLQIYVPPAKFDGASLIKSALGRQFISELLEIDEVTWKFERKLAILSGPDNIPNWARGSSKQVYGFTGDLSTAIVNINGYVNGVPQSELVLKHGVESIVFGEGLDPVEQDWLASVINEFL
eukprot:jgi/Picsp_1/1960/NSC_05426-R1_serine threonine protein kinase